MHLLLLLRPHNWIKNFFVFVPLFFAHGIFLSGELEAATLAFIIFSLTASAVYILNDLFDLEKDRLHPRKRLRPLAAGLVAPSAAIVIMLCLLIASGALIYLELQVIAPVIIVYFLANLGYSLYFKHVAVLDILMVAGFYVLRVSAGALAVTVPVSGWLLIATIFVALFLVTAKRKAELITSGEKSRAVLAGYTPEFLNATLLMSAVMLLVVYSMYTVTVLSSHLAVYSTFFVLLGVFRYLYLSMRGSETEQPERVIFSDSWIFLSAATWVVFMYFILY